MGQIKVLDQNMINMIAAGEVIERPASVVKELLENSIDAGATRITVSIEDGGRKLISVADNGCGMDAEDLARAFEPHTTSKIKNSDDLHRISTLGFRGEALASIGSVAQVRTTSKAKDSLTANCNEIDCGNKGNVNPCSGDYGTTIEIRDLFYKLPARRKFLKTANTETGHITEVFIRIALANANLDMTLLSNGREIYRLSGKDGLGRRIADLFSAEISQDLIETESQEKGLHILALIGGSHTSRTNNKFQYVFLNGRFIHDKFISHAIKEAYRGIIEPDRFPVVFLFIRLPFEDYDVNVHPTKIEVRFFNSNLIHSQILGVLRQKLLGTNVETPVKLPAKGSDPTTGTGQRSQNITDAMAEFFKRHRPANSQQQISFPYKPAERSSVERIENKAPYAERHPLNAIQIHDNYIVAQTEDGFIIVDQHALHERIMYENLRKRITCGNLESQKLLIPESFEITDAQAETIKDNSELIEKLGIELAAFGPKTMAIQSFPSILSKVSPLDFVGDLIDLLENKELSIDADRLLDEILNMAACKAAIKAGQKLNDREIEQLLADSKTVDCAGRCPHGRPTTIKFSMSELEKQFKRT
jgi:DNA mismatch repair protein MutL